MDTVTESWQRIEIWLQTFAPSYVTHLFAGTTPEALEEAEERLSLTLPADFKASYLLHNGTQRESYLLMGDLDLHSLGGVVGLRELNQQENAPYAPRTPDWVTRGEQIPVQPVWWHPAWLDFAWNDHSGHLCLDLAPATGGHYGQVLYWDHYLGVNEVLFPSLEALLCAYADQLEAGLYVQYGRPALPLRKLTHTHLQERRAAFQQRSSAKPFLEQAIRSAWNFASESYDEDFAAQYGLAPADGSDLWEDESVAPDGSSGGSILTFAQAFGAGYLTAYQKAFDHCVDLYQAVVRLPEATPEDRFFAYYGWISLYKRETDFPDDPQQMLFEQWKAEASNMPPTHWVHEEVALWKQWL